MKTITNVSPESIELFEGEGYENRLLTDYELTRRLEAHGNPIGIIDGFKYVQDDDGLFTVCTSNWTLFDLLDYLNY